MKQFKFSWVASLCLLISANYCFAQDSVCIHSSNIKVYPNPSHDAWNITLLETYKNSVALKLMDAFCNLVWEENLSVIFSNITQVPSENLPIGNFASISVF